MPERGASLISFSAVSKSYARGRARASLRDAIGTLLLRRGGAPDAEDSIQALVDVSFEIARGEVWGFVGPNGAGKSTILKLIAGITRPRSGSVVVRGRVAPLLELGAGFHPDLSGRENVMLSGLLLGMRRRDIAARFDRIVAFAELEDHIDEAVKNYSSGMYARLGFAVAAHSDPEILLVDEVIAVGDYRFERRCLQRVAELKREGCTVVLVSHDFATVRSMCTNAALVAGGRLVAVGEPAAVIERYLTLGGPAALAVDPDDASAVDAGRGDEGPRSVEITDVGWQDFSGAITVDELHGTDLVLAVAYRARQDVGGAKIRVTLRGSSGRHFFLSSTDLPAAALKAAAPPGRAFLRLRRPALEPGLYHVDVEILEELGVAALHSMPRACTLVVSRPEAAVVDLPHQWSHDDSAKG